MKITDYIAQHQMQGVDTQSKVKPGFVPSSLAAKFTLDDEVEYYADTSKTRWVGICRKRNFFAAWKSEAITTGELDKSYPTLRSF
jgi:hypothetical protein